MNNYILQIPYFNELKKVILDGGYDAYFVGGCVRDTILGRDIQDIDLVCFSHDYKEFANAVKNAVPSVWVEFKDNIRLVRGKTEIDISKPRGETLEEDLGKRDFTINNLAMDTGGKIYGNMDDLDYRIIRHVSDNSFTDDPLRILRTFRFQSQLDFKIADSTLQKVKAEKRLLEQSASERIFNELDKLFKGNSAATALRMMIDTNVFSIITNGLPTEQYDECIARAGRGLVFFAASLYCRLDDEAKSDIASRLNFPNAMKKRAQRLSEFVKQIAVILDDGDHIQVRKLIYQYPDELDDGLRIHLIHERCAGMSEMEAESREFLVMSELSRINFILPERLNGAVLQDIGVPPGPSMGVILKEVKPMMASGELTTFDKAVDYIKENYLRGQE